MESACTMGRGAGSALLAVAALLVIMIMEATMSGSARAGSRPAPCPDSPNCISSLSPPGRHAIDPLTLHQSPDQALRCLKGIVGSMKRARIVAEEETSLRAEFRTLLGFVDDVEFEVDLSQGLIHMRSASRLGYWDLGVNRRRLEFIRSAFDKTCR
jgi:uncharacterized protein (DUF1499 family)